VVLLFPPYFVSSPINGISDRAVSGFWWIVKRVCKNLMSKGEQAFMFAISVALFQSYTANKTFS